MPNKTLSHNHIRTVCNRAGPIWLTPAGWPKIGLLNRDFGSILSVFPRKKSKTQCSLNFLQSRPRKFSKSEFSARLGGCSFIDLMRELVFL